MQFTNFVHIDGLSAFPSLVVSVSGATVAAGHVDNRSVLQYFSVRIDSCLLNLGTVAWINSVRRIVIVLTRNSRWRAPYLPMKFQ